MAGKRKSGASSEGFGDWWHNLRARRQTNRTGNTGKRSGDKPTWEQRLKTVATRTLVSGLVLALVAVAGFLYLYKSIDIPDPNADFKTQTTYVYYDDGKTDLGSFAIQNRTFITYQEMPQNIKDAVVAAENRTFWTDSGIDPKGILRAAFNNASGDSTQGASTITQQYVKILYLNLERSYKRKVKEAILSLKIQREQSKQEVLSGYLNTIYFGRGAYGIQAAAQAYFGKDAADLSLREAAVLATVLNNPTRFDPANGKGAKKELRVRYDYVLGGMVGLEDGDAKGISTAQRDKAQKRLPKFPKIDAESTYGGQKGHLLAMVKGELLKTKDIDGNYFTEEQVNGGGLRVTTTFTKKAMDAAAAGVAEAKPEGFGDKFLHIAVASVEPGTGAVRGLYAGQDYLDSQLNWAIAGGQAGSSFKPFAVAAAIKDGYSLKDTFDGNSPYLLPDGTDVENEGDSDEGSAISLLTATEDSVNTAFVDLTLSMGDGPQKIVDMSNAMGIPPEAPKKNGPGFPDRTPGLEPITGVALGPQTVSPINMANGYATIANGGVAADPYIIDKVTDAKGDVLYEHKVSDERAVSTDIASDVSYALQQVVRTGTGTAAQAVLRPAAGKTGTATNAKGEVSSAWFTGYTPQLATSVMYVRGKGNEQLKGWLPSYFGGAYPAETWAAVMRRDMDGLDVEEFPAPAYVDGEAPQEGHVYVPPPAPPPSTTRRPPRNTETSEPTTQPPTSEPTTQPPTSQPPTPPPTSQPTGGCGLFTDCPTSAPPPPTSSPPSPPPTTPSPSKPGQSGAASSRASMPPTYATREMAPWWSAWMFPAA